LKKSEANPTARESFSRFLDYHKPTEHHTLRAGVQETHIPEKQNKKKKKTRFQAKKNGVQTLFLSFWLSSGVRPICCLILLSRNLST
jgi:hypothetical protein